MTCEKDRFLMICTQKNVKIHCINTFLLIIDMNNDEGTFIFLSLFRIYFNFIDRVIRNF
ncbi:MAG: hypothetical protein ACI94Y_002914 [Maribacter sp.]|jgi:hypothetical protein